VAGSATFRSALRVGRYLKMCGWSPGVQRTCYSLRPGGLLVTAGGYILPESMTASFHSVRVHGGAFIDPSPVAAPSRSIFRAADLTGVSGGVSLGSGSLTASLGVSSSWRTTTQQEVGPSLGAGRHNRREHSYLHGALLDLVYVLAGRTPV
jgi:hypothetical protein